jgi:hypothetical protein
VTALGHPRQRGDLGCLTYGSIDLVDEGLAVGTDGALALVGQDTLLEGWALACGQTPAEVLVLADGLIVGRTTRFEAARPDVAAATGRTAPSTWSIEADVRGLPPGERVLQVAVLHPEGNLHLSTEQRVRVESPLPDMARRATELLLARQDTSGYWLTSHTVAPQFTQPGREMNTFLTSMLVDVLAPLAAEHGLEVALERARQHLAAQVEADGLVRYHGLPDGPGMGVLGCPITPDSDDTALVWRIAPPPAGDPRQALMLRTLESYRTEEGLYRTWLAPQERYRCINPGDDPNPPDVTIQMNLLLMFAELDGAAAASLCRALSANVADAGLWVYYARAPLIPLLRTPDLRQAGCPVELPEERLVWVTGQESWRDAVYRLVVGPAARGTEREEAALRLLVQLGRDDFAALRATPPLLYHNDLTASVSRYYWSEDFGYALWLRLYQQLHDGTEAAAAGGQ